MNNLQVAGVILVATGVLLPLLNFDIPSPINSLFLVDESATSSSYIFFPFINWLSLIGISLLTIGYVQDRRFGKRK